VNKTHVSALGALVLMATAVSGCASEEAQAPAAPTAVETTAEPTHETVFQDFLILGDAPDADAARPLWAGKLDTLAYYVRPSEEFKNTFSGEDMFAFNQLAGQYFVEQVVDSEVLDVKDADAIQEHATGLSDLLTSELAAELAAAEPTWDDVLFPSNLGADGMTADPDRETVSGTRFASVDVTLASLDVTEDGERPVLVYQADTVRPVLDGAGEPRDEHRTILGTFEVDDVDGQWRISSIDTELTGATTAPGEQLG
jgi:hypothetical protein